MPAGLDVTAGGFVPHSAAARESGVVAIAVRPVVETRDWDAIEGVSFVCGGTCPPLGAGGHGRWQV
ncbi:hypothetical protein GCM10022206_67840 [Streptomyces chiangmaiensis]